MKLLSRNYLACIVVALVIFRTHQDCLNLCYSRQIIGYGQCDICYFECSNSAEAYFTSCRFESQETGESKELTESQCYSHCYPEMVQELKTLEEVSEKLNLEQAPNRVSSSLHQVSNGQLQKQLEKDERDMDIVIFIMAGGCALFTILAIIMIIKCFDSKDQSKRTIETKYYESEEKDLPDIQIDSSSSYYSTKEDQKINL